MDEVKPIAFIDVDGVLNRVVSNSVGKKRKLLRVHGWSDGLRWPLWLDPEDGDRIKTLGDHFELGWGSTWQDDAYDQVGRRIGFPEFDIIARTNYDEMDKTQGVVRAAQGRPFVWFDDDTDYEDISLFVDQPHKVILVDPAEGLTDDHIIEAIEWSKGCDPYVVMDSESR